MKTLAGSRRRSNKNNEQALGGSPAWMTTYGDLITQILIFFVLLFSFSNVDRDKFTAAMLSLQGSLGIIDGGMTLQEGDLMEQGEIGEIMISVQEQREFELLHERVEEIISEDDLNGIQVNLDERGLVIRFVEGVLFDSGKADIKNEARAILDKIAPLLIDTHRHIRIEGHTDNLPINTREFPSNWELSTARAVNVVKYFIEKHNFSPYILSAAGYGEYRPIAPNDSDKNRALNRRVDIIILKSTSESTEPR
ncbi:MAG: OmpA family protein [Tepidanaerobacteraceae bacterium]|nr:OmpA family protein [Tepidanaerobacteraceae bacterium]HQE05242.1 OmpA family protein [Tepidanaerobacteraceae bacterium]